MQKLGFLSTGFVSLLFLHLEPASGANILRVRVRLSILYVSFLVTLVLKGPGSKRKPRYWLNIFEPSEFSPTNPYAS